VSDHVCLFPEIPESLPNGMIGVRRLSLDVRICSEWKFVVLEKGIAQNHETLVRSLHTFV